MTREQWMGEFRVGGRVYGGRRPVYVIAEIGSNHNGSLERAKQLIRESAAAGADAVKFQSWTARGLQNVKDVGPDGTLSESKAIPVLEKYQFPTEWHAPLAEYCAEQGVDFLSTPFDLERARLLRSVGVPAIKIASGDLTYSELLQEVGGYGLPLFLSTGMAQLEEIEEALRLLGQDERRDVVLLHCVGAYPPQIEDANLLAIRTLAETFRVPVGISDHYLTNQTVLAAVALGAAVVEKHVTISRQDGAPDSFFALEMPELRAMIESIRLLEKGLGSGEKCCMPGEAGGRVGGRRSLFAARDLVAGQVLTRDDVAVVRPNVGELQPADLDSILGARVTADIPCGTPLRRTFFTDRHDGV